MWAQATYDYEIGKAAFLAIFVGIAFLLIGVALAYRPRRHDETAAKLAAASTNAEQHLRDGNFSAAVRELNRYAEFEAKSYGPLIAPVYNFLGNLFLAIGAVTSALANSGGRDALERLLRVLGF